MQLSKQFKKAERRKALQESLDQGYNLVVRDLRSMEASFGPVKDQPHTVAAARGLHKLDSQLPNPIPL